MKTTSLARLTPAWLTAMIFAAGCGNTVVEGTGGASGTGDAGGTGGGTGGGTTTSSTTSVVPPACAVATDEPGPYPVAFHFTNAGAQPLFLRQDCALDYSITACDTDYADPIGLSGSCTVDCSEADTCIQCGPCPEGGVAVASGAPVDDNWSGLTYTFGQNSSGCSCHTEHVAPAQKYRITVPVFASAEDAMTNNPMWQASADFTLPAPGGVVDVDLAVPK